MYCIKCSLHFDTYLNNALYNIIFNKGIIHTYKTFPFILVCDNIIMNRYCKNNLNIFCYVCREFTTESQRIPVSSLAITVDSTHCSNSFLY